jgi:hypothetical protein
MFLHGRELGVSVLPPQVRVPLRSVISMVYVLEDTSFLARICLIEVYLFESLHQQTAFGQRVE